MKSITAKNRPLVLEFQRRTGIVHVFGAYILDRVLDARFFLLDHKLTCKKTNVPDHVRHEYLFTGSAVAVQNAFYDTKGAEATFAIGLTVLDDGQRSFFTEGEITFRPSCTTPRWYKTLFEYNHLLADQQLTFPTDMFAAEGPSCHAWHLHTIAGQESLGTRVPKIGESTPTRTCHICGKASKAQPFHQLKVARIPEVEAWICREGHAF